MKSDAQIGVRECSDHGFCHTVLPPGETLRGVWGDGQGIVWAASESGRILRWDGSTWAIHTSTIDNAFFAIWGSGPTDIWALGLTGILHGTGVSASAIVFAPVGAPGDSNVLLTSIWGTGPNDIWAVGGDQNAETGDFPYPAKGRVVHYTGTGWVLDNEEPLAFRAVWGSPNSGVWTVGSIEAKPENNDRTKAIVRRRRPGSNSWVEVAMPSDPDPWNQWGPDPEDLRVGSASSDGSIWLAGVTQSFIKVYYHGTSVDNGLTFTWTMLKRAGGDFDLTSAWGTAPNDTWAAGDYGRLRHWDGARWEQAAIMVSHVPVTNPLYAIWGKSSDDFWVVGEEIALHKTPGKP